MYCCEHRVEVSWPVSILFAYTEQNGVGVTTWVCIVLLLAL